MAAGEGVGLGSRATSDPGSTGRPMVPLGPKLLTCKADQGKSAQSGSLTEEI